MTQRGLTILFTVLAAIMVTDSTATGSENILSVDKVRELAVTHNRNFLQAKEEVRKAGSQVVTARADALPDISISASYDRNFQIPTMFVQAGDSMIPLRTGYKYAFGSTASVRQSIWEGGKVFAAMSISRLYKKYALEGEESARAQVINSAELLFYQAILARAQKTVFDKAFETASYNLDIAQKFFDQGMASQYELLRARVEKANLQPQLINAESEVRLADKRLKSFIGLDLSDSITLAADPSDTTVTDLPALPALIDQALAQRPEVAMAGHLETITKKAIWVAKADYSPTLDAVAAYSWQGMSDRFSPSERNSRSSSIGLRLSVPLFKGFRQSGQIAYRKADYNQARLKAAQTRDDVRLEVESAFDNLAQAKKALDVQAETIAQAEEGLKIANVRYQSGVGTQLEVLSAQTALTQARTAQAEAHFRLRAAKSALKKATTLDIH
jgi:outer membrane protein